MLRRSEDRTFGGASATTATADAGQFVLERRAALAAQRRADLQLYVRSAVMLLFPAGSASGRMVQGAVTLKIRTYSSVPLAAVVGPAGGS
jgi:hypothetical protein